MCAKNESIHVRKADIVINRAGVKLSKKYNMHLVGTGGSMPDNVRTMYLAFSIYKPLAIEESRKILVGSIQDFLQDINTDEGIRPYLDHYPFTVGDIELTIVSFDNNRREVFDPYIAVTSVANGQLKYATKDPEKKYGYKSEIEETYEEALNNLNK